MRTRFSWTTEDAQVFVLLREMFSFTPVLILPDPSRQLVIEVDALYSGVGPILSHRSATNSRLQPCTLFSCRLSPTEVNYSTRYQEPLAIKMALEG